MLGVSNAWTSAPSHCRFDEQILQWSNFTYKNSFENDFGCWPFNGQLVSRLPQFTGGWKFRTISSNWLVSQLVSRPTDLSSNWLPSMSLITVNDFSEMISLLSSLVVTVVTTVEDPIDHEIVVLTGDFFRRNLDAYPPIKRKVSECGAVYKETCSTKQPELFGGPGQR